MTKYLKSQVESVEIAFLELIPIVTKQLYLILYMIDRY